MSLPKHSEAQEILADFRSANTPKAKQEVIKNVQKRFPEIAKRLSKLLVQKQEVVR